MLKEVVRVCSELKLTYYLVCGSALGAIKYRGFIPWDDDTDFALPRRDYEIFIKEAQALLEVSQSTAGRILKEMVDKGQIATLGTGRALRYELV